MDGDLIETYLLKNGLQVIAKRVDSVPVVSVFVWYRVGSADEPAGQSGLAHFLEHMLFKGSERFPKGEISRLVGRTGGQQNAFTSYDYTAYYETVPSEQLVLALDIETDRMRHALLDPVEVERERTVILSELEGNRNSPHVRLRDLVNAQTWTQHPYRRPVVGWREEVEALTPGQLKTFYDTYYQPNNANLVVVGKFDPKTLKALIEARFGAVAEGPLRPQRRALAETQNGERRVRLVDHGPAAILQLNLPIPPAGSADHFALTVLNDALTRGRTSRLYRALVDQGLATEVSSSPNEMIDNGVWEFLAIAQTQADPQKLEQVLRSELVRVQRELLSPREFQQAVNQTRAQLIYAKDSITDQAMLLGYYQTVAGDWRRLDEFPERVAQVTPEQVRAAAQKYLADDHMTLGWFLPLPGSAPGPVRLEHGRSASFLPRMSSSGPEGVQAQAGSAGSAPAQRFVLPNGLVLLVQPNPANPMVVLSGLVRGGMAVEPEGLPGLAVVLAQLLDRGTRRRTAEQLAQDLEFKAANLDFGAQVEELNISGEALSEDLELLLTALAECLQQATFPSVELEKVRQQTLTACRLAQDNTALQAWQGFCGLAYPAGHPWRRSLLTAEPGLRRLKRSDLLAFQQQNLRPEATILSLSGQVDPEHVHSLVERLFHDWKSTGAPLPADPPAMPPTQAAALQAKVLPGKKECIVVLGHEGIRRLDPDYYPAYVANHILGGSGLSSQLMRTVRDDAGLTYSIYSQFKLSHGTRPWMVSFQADPAKVQAAIQLTLQAVRRLQTGEVSAQDLDDAREQLIGGLALSLETNQGLAHLNREIEYHGLGLDYLTRYPLAIRAVDAAQVKAASLKWLHPDRCLTALAGPALPEASGSTATASGN